MVRLATAARRRAAPALQLPWPGTRGLSIHVEQSSRGDTGFLLLHGFTFNSSTWHDVFHDFAALAPTVAYDRVPFGRSGKLAAGEWTGPNPYTPEAALAQLFALMDAVGLKRAVLVGSSAGGLLAARAALTAPGRVAGLILACPAILTLPSAAGGVLLRLPFPGKFIARRVGDNGWLLKRSFRDPRRVTAERLAHSRIALQSPGWDLALWEFMKASTVQPDIAAKLNRIAQPVLVVGGAGDRVVRPEDNATLARMMPRAELAMIEDAGHLPHEEQPAQFMEAVRGWMDRAQPFGDGG